LLGASRKSCAGSVRRNRFKPRWRVTNFLRHANDRLDPDPLLDPVRKAIGTVEAHSKRILQRWTSSHSNARLEA
jgi:transposase